MSSLRTHDDTWDIATSVGTTAVMVAAARAAETEQADPLIPIPTPTMLVAGAGTGDVGRRCSTTDRRRRPPPSTPRSPRSSGTCATTRPCARTSSTRYFAEAAAAGIRQIVILASGLDSRAYRIEWPAGTTVFEIDQPKVLEYKAATLADNGVKPAAQLPRGCRWTCATTGRTALREAASTPTSPPRGWPRAC